MPILTIAVAALVGAPTPDNDSLRLALKAYEAREGAKAIALLEPLVQKGVPKAQWLLGSIYYEGPVFFPGSSKNQVVASELIHLAAKNGNVDAQYFLGNEYSTGTGNNGIPQNLEKGVYWFKAAAMQGDINSMVMLGSCFLEGRGTRKNPAEALLWYRKAAGKGNSSAMLWLGRMYKDGNGVLQDFIEAYAWLNLSALTDSSNSKPYERDALVSIMTPAQLEKGQERSKFLNKQLKL